MKVLVVVVHNPSLNPGKGHQTIASETITASSEAAIRFGITSYLGSFVDIKSHSITVLDPHLRKDPTVKA